MLAGLGVQPQAKVVVPDEVYRVVECNIHHCTGCVHVIQTQPHAQSSASFARLCQRTSPSQMKYEPVRNFLQSSSGHLIYPPPPTPMVLTSLCTHLCILPLPKQTDDVLIVHLRGEGKNAESLYELDEFEGRVIDIHLHMRLCTWSRKRSSLH